MREKEKTVRMFRVDKYGTTPVTDKDIPRLEKIGGDNTTFIRVLNFSDVERSMRFNPIQKRYLPRLQDCQALADNLVYSGLNWGKTEDARNNFFFRAASNFLAATIHFFVNYKENKHSGKSITYSDFPHMIAFLNHDYYDIFEVLRTDHEIYPLLAPFITAYDNKAMEQLEGMFGTLRVQLARMATRESFWILGLGNDDFRLYDDFRTDYVTIVTDNRHDPIGKMYASLVLNTDEIPEGTELNTNNRTVRRILEYKRFSFPSEESRERILWENYQTINENADMMIRKFINPRTSTKRQ